MKKNIAFFLMAFIPFSGFAKQLVSKNKKNNADVESVSNANADTSVLRNDTSSSTATQKEQKPKRILVDKMVGIVHGPERSQIFCLSDQSRRGIDGRERSLEDSISEELVYQDAIRFKIPIDDVVVKEHLNRTIQMFGLKPGEEETIFAQEGYTYQEGFEKFRLMYANNVMIDYRIKQGMLIPEDEVISYYNAHPIEKEPKYQLQTAFVPVEREKGKKARGVEMDIDRFIKTGSGIDINWSDPYWILESDLAEGLDFISTMSEGVVKKQKVADGFQLYEMKKMKPKRTVPLKKRYRDIVETLRKPKFEVTFQKYKKSLFDAATIVHL